MFTITVNIPHVTVHVHHEADASVLQKLEVLSAQLTALHQQGVQHMAVTETIRVFAARVDAATNEIASDIRVLRDKVAAGTPLTEEDQAELDRLATALEALGRDPENPVPGETEAPEGSPTEG